MIASANEIIKASHLESYLSQSHLFPKCRKIRATGEFCLSFFQRGMQHAVQPAILWVEKIQEALPDAIITQIHDTHAQWKLGNPVITATVTLHIPDWDAIKTALIYYFCIHLPMMQCIALLALKFKSLVKEWDKLKTTLIYYRLIYLPTMKRLALLALKFKVDIQRWKESLRYRLPAPNPDKIQTAPKIGSITDAIMFHGAEKTSKAIQAMAQAYGNQNQYQYIQNNPMPYIPTYEELAYDGPEIILNLPKVATT